MIKIAIVILHFNNQEQTLACLLSINRLETKGLKVEVNVINNNPKENLYDLKEKFPRFLFLDTKKNLGYAAGNNLGIKRALENKSDFIFILNNDTILDEKILLNLIDSAGSNKKIGILGPKIYFAPGYEFHQEKYQTKDQGKVIWYAGGLIDWQNMVSSHRGVDEIDHSQYDTSKETDFVTGCAMFVRKDVFEKVGLFDEKYFLYLEDVDFCQRARKAGFKIFYVPTAKLWHFNAGSSEVGGKIHDYYLSRNRLLFGFKYASWRTKFALIRESLKILFKGSPWQKLGVRDFYLRRFGQAGFKL